MFLAWIVGQRNLSNIWMFTRWTHDLAKWIDPAGLVLNVLLFDASDELLMIF